MPDSSTETSSVGPMRFDAAQRLFSASHVPGSSSDPATLPREIGHFQIDRILGESWGTQTFLAHRRDRDVPWVVHRYTLGLVPDEHAALRDELRRTVIESVRLRVPLEESGDEDGCPYIVWPYIPGVALDRYADRHDLNTTERIRLLTRLCQSVQRLHQSGRPHGDLKPGHVIVDAKGEVHLVGLGVSTLLRANLRDIDADERFIARALQYRAPETIDQPTVAFSIVNDQYALAAIAWRLLAGRPPHELDELRRDDAIQRCLDDDPIVSGTRQPLTPVLIRALEAAVSRTPSARPKSVNDLGDVLRSQGEQATVPWWRRLGRK
ncbi:MAG: protein kinase [Planctomycetota bacterium]